MIPGTYYKWGQNKTPFGVAIFVAGGLVGGCAGPAWAPFKRVSDKAFSGQGAFPFALSVATFVGEGVDQLSASIKARLSVRLRYVCQASPLQKLMWPAIASTCGREVAWVARKTGRDIG